MSGEDVPTKTRERLWVRKLDHSTEPPTPIEELFIENGVIQSVTDLRPLQAVCCNCGGTEVTRDDGQDHPGVGICAVCGPTFIDDRPSEV